MGQELIVCKWSGLPSAEQEEVAAAANGTSAGCEGRPIASRLDAAGHAPVSSAVRVREELNRPTGGVSQLLSAVQQCAVELFR